MNKQHLLNMIGDLVEHAREQFSASRIEDDNAWTRTQAALCDVLFAAIDNSALTEGAYSVPVYACRHWNDDSKTYDLEVFETLTDELIDAVEISDVSDQRDWCEARFIRFYDE